MYRDKDIIDNLPIYYKRIYDNVRNEDDRKICKKCKSDYPMDILFFTPNKNTKDGFLYCRGCSSNFFEDIKNKGFSQGLKRIFKNYTEKEIKVCKKCGEGLKNNRDNFPNSYAVCRSCSGKKKSHFQL